jgi:hypothetical protein
MQMKHMLQLVELEFATDVAFSGICSLVLRPFWTFANLLSLRWKGIAVWSIK